MTPEGKLVAYIKRVVIAAGGQVRKCEWAGHAGAPDLFIMINGDHFWVECKAPGKRPRIVQEREIMTMKAAGCHVFVVDTPLRFDIILNLFLGAS